MITENKKKIGKIFFGTKAIAYIYIGAKLIWRLINSCFGAGYWVSESGWSNEDGWNN